MASKKSTKKSTKAARHKKESAAEASRRAYVKQADVPNASLEDALRVPKAIFDHYGGKAATPMQVAKALDVDPKGSQLRLLSGAAIAFGLIEGGAQATTITVTELARRIVRQKEEGDDLRAKREALLKPRVFSDFLTRYNNSPFPRDDIAINVLEEMGVPRSKAEGVLTRLLSSAKSVGFIEEIKNKSYVSLHGAADFRSVEVEDEEGGQDGESREDDLPSRDQVTIQANSKKNSRDSDYVAAVADDLRRKRVFITHGKNKDLVEPITKLLEFGELEAIVSVDRQSVSKPVPEKVMDDMRNSGAAIIHVDADNTIIDKEGKEHVVLNPNVLIEIGAAMAFYGRRFILLVKEGVKLPSNLQGLYEVRYTDDRLDSTATIKLLEAIKDIKNYALPGKGP